MLIPAITKLYVQSGHGKADASLKGQWPTAMLNRKTCNCVLIAAHRQTREGQLFQQRVSHFSLFQAQQTQIVTRSKPLVRPIDGNDNANLSSRQGQMLGSPTIAISR